MMNKKIKQFPYESLCDALYLCYDINEFMDIVENRQQHQQQIDPFLLFNIVDLVFDQCLVKMIEYLLKHSKIDVYIQNPYGQTIMDLAMIKRNGRFAKLLDKYHATTNQVGFNNIEKAAICGNLEKLKKISTKDDYETIIHLAAECGWLHIIKYLLYKCHVDPNTLNSLGRNILHLAASQGHFNLAKWIIMHTKVDIVQLDRFNFTPLTIANNGNLIKFLLSRHNCYHFISVCNSARVINKLVKRDGFLNLSNINLGDSGCKVIGLSLRHETSHAKTIDLSRNLRISHNGIKFLVDSFQMSDKIRHLIISDLPPKTYNLLIKYANTFTFTCEFPTLLTIAADFITTIFT